MPDYVLGVHDGHNGAAAVLKDGHLEFAIQEERLTGNKNETGFPRKSVQACLDFVGATPSDVSELALSSIRQTPDGFRTLDQRTASDRDATLYGFFRRLFGWYPYYRLNTSLGWNERLKIAGELGFTPAQLKRYGHHRAHAASAYYGMRENPEETYLVITLDGFGDLESGTVFIAEKGKLEQIASTPLTDSIGSVYGWTTGQMGFTPLEHEYKLMGMAPYASDKYSQGMSEAFQSLITVDEQKLRLRRTTWEPTFAYPRRLRRMISGQRFDNVCAGLQSAFEEIVVNLVGAAVRKTGIRRVLCAGGNFMNVKANKRIMELDEVDFLAVVPSAGDESLCMGVAWLGCAERGESSAATISPLDSIYLGTDIEEEATLRLLRQSNHDYARYDDIENEVVRVLAAQHPVARCKGRLEFGARALGNRSILADPQNQDIVRIINRMVKKRDFWMPFAPVVRDERMNDYFVNPKRL
jgi:carbamoyltransferase